MKNYSCERILSAVGRMLDDAGAAQFAIRDGENGLTVETFDGDGEPQLALNFDLADLVELVERVSPVENAPRYERSYGHDERTLRSFLERHELVGAGR